MNNVIKKILPNSIHFLSQTPVAKIAVFSILYLPMLDAYAGEQEVWYNAKGVPVLVKDKATGRVRVPTLDELAVLDSNAKGEPEETLFIEPDTEIQPPSSIEPVVTPLVLNPSAVPLQLTPRRYSSGLPYGARNHYYSPYLHGGGAYYSNYVNLPYTRPVIPQFSRNGYYRPARYYPTYRHYNNYYGNYRHHHCRNGFLLQYSRPNFTIRARF